MRIEVRYTGIEISPALSRHVQRHVRFALARFRPEVDYVGVVLSRVWGRGMHDKECSIVVSRGGEDSAVVRQIGSDIFAVVARAAERSGRSMARQMTIERFRSARSVHPERIK